MSVIATSRTRGAVAALATGACALLLASCAAGPDFHKPAAPNVARYGPEPTPPTVATPGVAGGEAQAFDESAKIAGDWWTLFRSRPLNALIDEALKTNHDLKAAQAALTAAHETTLAQRGAFLPSVSAGLQATRQKTSAALAPTPSDNSQVYSLYTPQVSVAYTPDVFGLTRRTVEQSRAQEEAARFQMIAAHLALTSNVVAAAVQDASIAAQLDATRKLAAADAQIVEIVKLQQAKGYASGLDLAAQESQLAQAQAALPPLEKQAEQQRHLLAVLVGRYPSQADFAPFDLSALTLPTDLPLSLPSALVEQRPDVRQAQANLHAASAAVGIAAANRLPNIQLTGAIGNSALTLKDAFGPGSSFWTIGAALTQPIFQGGALLHQARGARALYVQAAEQYRSTVLTAFQNVADTLSAIEKDALALQATAHAEQAAKTTLDLSTRQYQDGYTGYLTVLSAQQAYQQARIARIQAQAARFADTAALYQALGGGWWTRADLASNDIPKLSKGQP